MSDLWHYTKIGFLIGAGVVAAILAAFAVLLAPGFVAEAMYGSPWGVIVGLPWAVVVIIAAAVVITAAEDGQIHLDADPEKEASR